MKKLEEYVNEQQVNEGFFDFFKNLFKAAGKSISKSIHDTYEKAYPNFMKTFDELQKADAEDKELIKKFNTMYETIDKMKDVSDDEKVFHKLNLLMAETGRFDDGDQGEGVKKLDKEKHKGYLADLQKKLKDIEANHKEIYGKYQEAAKKGEIKKEDIIGKGDTKNEVPPTVQKAGEHEEELDKGVEQAAEKDSNLKSDKEKLDTIGQDETLDSKGAIKFCDDAIKDIDNSKYFDDDFKLDTKIRAIMNELARFGLDPKDEKYLPKDQYEDYYNHLNELLQQLNKENPDKVKEFINAINKGEVPEAKPTEDGDENQQVPTEAAAKEHAKDLSAAIQDVGLSNSDFNTINDKMKKYLGVSESRKSLVEFINSINETKREDVQNKLKQLLSVDDKEAKKKINAALSYIFIGYEAIKRAYGKEFDHDYLRALVQEYEKA